jgi:hypothetical protein
MVESITIATAILCISYSELGLIVILQGKYMIQAKVELIYKPMLEGRLITIKSKLLIIEKILMMKCLYKCLSKNLFVIKKKLNHSNK